MWGPELAVTSAETVTLLFQYLAAVNKLECMFFLIWKRDVDDLLLQGPLCLCAWLVLAQFTAAVYVQFQP